MRVSENRWKWKRDRKHIGQRSALKKQAKLIESGVNRLLFSPIDKFQSTRERVSVDKNYKNKIFRYSEIDMTCNNGQMTEIDLFMGGKGGRVTSVPESAASPSPNLCHCPLSAPVQVSKVFNPALFSSTLTSRNSLLRCLVWWCLIGSRK